MITKKEFESYKRVQESGRTNLFMVKNVEILSGLEREKILEIMKNYEELSKRFTGGD